MEKAHGKKIETKNDQIVELNKNDESSEQWTKLMNKKQLTIDKPSNKQVKKLFIFYQFLKDHGKVN